MTKEEFESLDRIERLETLVKEQNKAIELILDCIRLLKNRNETSEMIISNLVNAKLENNSDSELSKCPECNSPVIEKWSGIKCSKCNWWECI